MIVNVRPSRRSPPSIDGIYLVFGRVTLPRLVGIVALVGIGFSVVHVRPEVTSAAATLFLAHIESPSRT
ncbi:hypothetical protein ACVCAH_34575 [Micromonospora sp. LZ34]